MCLCFRILVVVGRGFLAEGMTFRKIVLSNELRTTRQWSYTTVWTSHCKASTTLEVQSSIKTYLGRPWQEYFWTVFVTLLSLKSWFDLIQGQSQFQNMERELRKILKCLYCEPLLIYFIDKKYLKLDKCQSKGFPSRI